MKQWHPSPETDALVREFFREAFVDTAELVAQEMAQGLLLYSCLNRLGMPGYLEALAQPLNIQGYTFKRTRFSGVTTLAESPALTPILDELFVTVPGGAGNFVQASRYDTYLACQVAPGGVEAAAENLMRRRKLLALLAQLREE